MAYPPIRSLPAIGLLGSLAVQAPGTPVPPWASDSNYVFAFPADGPCLEVEPGSGARLASLRLGSAELLIPKRSNLAWGSTFWTSPQSIWG